MPAPMANRLGYPARQIGWSDIFALVDNPAGWASVGMPQWGKFKLAKTNPTISTSGLHALIGTYTAAGGTTVAGVESPPVRALVGKIESSVVHYAPTASENRSGDCTDELQRRLIEAESEMAGSRNPRDAEAGRLLLDYYIKCVGTHEVVMHRIYLSRPTFYRRLNRGLALASQRISAAGTAPPAAAG